MSSIQGRPHIIVVMQHALQSVEMLPWPARSTDLSPIGHAWDIIGRSPSYTARTDLSSIDTTSTTSMELHTTKLHSAAL
ncbi:hypothetical protein TNCV_3880491 [Trichonephila clavipes]|nr:hypothetical protein TNCV_3880491 [Trichonephila clavipes]